MQRVGLWKYNDHMCAKDKTEVDSEFALNKW
jgi:hypothetical protein